MKLEFVDFSVDFKGKGIIRASSFEFGGGINLLLGRNGSGKTSLLKSLVSLNPGGRGKIFVDGNILADYGIKSVCGFQFEVDFLPNNLYPKEMLSLCGRLQDIGNPHLIPRINYLVDLFEIDFRSQIQFLSYGNKKKLLLALSLLNSPKALVWDEPFEGLDEIVTQKILSFLKSSNFELVVISTNNMYLAQELNSRVTLINRHRKVETMEEFDLEYIRSTM